MRILIASLCLVLLIAPCSLAQKYYAVIITTFGPDNAPTLPSLPTDLVRPSGNDFFWNDTFLQWKLLTNNQQGGAQAYDNVYVFYNRGSDFLSPLAFYWP